MTGRSSRTMSYHESIMVIVSTNLSKQTIENHLANVQLTKLRDALWCAKALLGKHLLSHSDDEAVMDLYRKGWMVQKHRLMRIYESNDILKYMKEAERWITENSGELISKK